MATDLFFCHCRHTGEHLLRRQIIHQAQVPAFVPAAVQENYRGYALDRELAEQTRGFRVPFLGEVHLYHDKILVSQFHHIGVMKGDLIQLPAARQAVCNKACFSIDYDELSTPLQPHLLPLKWPPLPPPLKCLWNPP
jgi:hypothetical protein